MCMASSSWVKTSAPKHTHPLIGQKEQYLGRYLPSSRISNPCRHGASTRPWAPQDAGYGRRIIMIASFVMRPIWNIPGNTSRQIHRDGVDNVASPDGWAHRPMDGCIARPMGRSIRPCLYVGMNGIGGECFGPTSSCRRWGMMGAMIASSGGDAVVGG